MCCRNTAINLVPVLLFSHSLSPDGHQAPKVDIINLTKLPCQKLGEWSGSPPVRFAEDRGLTPRKCRKCWATQISRRRFKNTKQPQLRFRAPLTDNGTQPLELVRD